MPAIQDTIARAIAMRLQNDDYKENEAAKTLANDLWILEHSGPKSVVHVATLNLYEEIVRCANSVDLALRDLGDKR